MLLFYRPLTKNYFIIAKGQKTTIIHTVFGVSSNGRTRDFGSLYHGSNPCAPTTLRVYDASCGRPHRRSSYREVVSTLALAKADRNKNQMFYVYLIKSISHPEQKYIGQTDDLKNRLKQHNAGYSIHTAKYKPWELVNYFAFSSKDAALEFEQYLKTGSGYAFAKRHFWK